MTMFKLAIISSLAVAAANAVSVDVDADRSRRSSLYRPSPYRHRFAGPPSASFRRSKFGGPSNRGFKNRPIYRAPKGARVVGNIGKAPRRGGFSTTNFTTKALKPLAPLGSPRPFQGALNDLSVLEAGRRAPHPNRSKGRTYGLKSSSLEEHPDFIKSQIEEIEALIQGLDPEEQERKRLAKSRKLAAEAKSLAESQEKLAEEKRITKEKRLAKEKEIAEEQEKIADEQEKMAAEQERLAEEKKAAEETKKAAEEAIAEEQEAIAEEQERLAAEQEELAEA